MIESVLNVATISLSMSPLKTHLSLLTFIKKKKKRYHIMLQKTTFLLLLLLLFFGINFRLL